MVSIFDLRLRWFSMLFISLAAGLLIWGNVVFEPYLQGFAALAYWGICLAFVILALMGAALDAFVVYRRARTQHLLALQRLIEPAPSRSHIDQSGIRNS